MNVCRSTLVLGSPLSRREKGNNLVLISDSFLKVGSSATGIGISGTSKKRRSWRMSDLL